MMAKVIMAKNWIAHGHPPEPLLSVHLVTTGRTAIIHCGWMTMRFWALGRVSGLTRSLWPRSTCFQHLCLLQRPSDETGRVFALSPPVRRPCPSLVRSPSRAVPLLKHCQCSHVSSVWPYHLLILAARRMCSRCFDTENVSPWLLVAHGTLSSGTTSCPLPGPQLSFPNPPTVSSQLRCVDDKLLRSGLLRFGRDVTFALSADTLCS